MAYENNDKKLKKLLKKYKKKQMIDKRVSFTMEKMEEYLTC